MNTVNVKLNSTDYLILNELQSLVAQFTKDKDNFCWIARQLIQKSLLNKFQKDLKIDTIYRSFKRLHTNGLIKYEQSGWFKTTKDKFIILKDIFSKKSHTISLSLNSQIQFIAKKYTKINIDIKDEYGLFVAHYENNNIVFTSYNYLHRKWKSWVKRIREVKQQVKMISILDANLTLDDEMIDIATKYMNQSIIKDVFDNFIAYHTSKLSKYADWKAAWKVWCFNYKKFDKALAKNTKSKQVKTTKQQEKQDYRWDFRKAKDISDRIKEWLEYEKNIDWLNDYYLKDIAIPGLGWQEVQHPDFNKEEILLFKLDSKDAQHLLNDNIEDVEIV